MSNNIEAAGRPRPSLSSPGAKALIIALLALSFLLPLRLVETIVDARRATRDAADSSIIEPLGGEPRLFGPYLVLPYEKRSGKELTSGEVVVLSSKLEIESSLSSESRSRGLFSAAVLSADASLAGRIDATAALALLPRGAAPRWEAARIVVELQDLRSIAEAPSLKWRGADLRLRPDPRGGLVYSKALSASLGPESAGSGDFSASFRLRGGASISFLEPAGSVSASLKGDWPSPSFFGYSSPVERAVSKEGFSARWYLPESSQGLPPAFRAEDLPKADLAASAFGVRLLSGVDAYDMAWRAVRYGLLFIVAPFALLFLFEILAHRPLHPVQYGLVGLANCVFYLLLLSLSEILGFGWAYALAAAACCLLCAAYAAASLKSRLAFAVLPALAALYAYLYLALSSEDYALLIGALGLFAIVAAAMAATRKVDWYGRPDRPHSAAPEEARL